jgi:hypothetical protein
MTAIRNRVGTLGSEFILGLIVQTGLATKMVAAVSLASVNLGTTAYD